MVIFTGRMKIGNKGLFCSPRISLVLHCTSRTVHSITTSQMVVIVTGHLKRGKKKGPFSSPNGLVLKHGMPECRNAGTPEY